MTATWQQEWETERFLTQNRSFILRTASRHCGRYISVSDDEWSIALSACYEAMQHYDQAQGSFHHFAALLIARRLTDYFRSMARFSSEQPVTPQAFDGAVEQDTPDAALQQRVAAAAAQTQPLSAQEEIAAANTLFQPFGFSFADLADASPRAEKTRHACGQAVACLLTEPMLRLSLQRSQKLPMRALTERSGVSAKLLDRHRRYIIAAALLLDGDFPILSTYLRAIKKEVAACKA